MEAQHKTRLKAIVLNLRHILEGRSDAAGIRQPGDLEVRLAALGIRADRPAVPLDQIPHLSAEDRNARQVVDAFLESHRKNGVGPEEALPEFIRESAYTWANRLIALRCMEARGLIDEIILQKENYGGRSLQHHRLARQNPERCAGEDGGLYAALTDEFARRAIELPLLFDPQTPAVALKPGIAALKECIRLLSASDELFTAPDALGWAYQYWNTEEKDRVFERVRTVKGAKIEKLDIIPVTQLYTEPYMVKFLVQNSLGALWMAMHPESRLCDAWEYYVRDADRPPAPPKPVRKISFLDPCTGSGHFLLEAFDLLYAMYEEEGELNTPVAICDAILTRNLFGIDIDERSVQIGALALIMKAKEKAPDFTPTRINLTAANIHPANGPDRLTAFLEKHPEDKPLQKALAIVFESLAHADELGSLLQIEEPVEKELRFLKALDDEEKTGQDQTVLPLKEFDTTEQQRLPLGVESYEKWKTGLMDRLKAHFHDETTSADLSTRFFGQAASKGLSLFDFLSRRYDVVATNPPYMSARTMGTTIKCNLSENYKLGKNDLYLAFTLRALNLCKPSGFVAMVTMNKWLYLKAFTELRKLITENYFLSLLVDLGSNAFGEISGEVVKSALFIIRNEKYQPNNQLKAMRVNHIGTVNLKNEFLLNICSEINANNISSISYEIIPKLPGCAFFFWLPPDISKLLYETSINTKNVLENANCSKTGDNERFLRHQWEIEFKERKIPDRWINYTKGGSYKKWRGHDSIYVDWREATRFYYSQDNVARLTHEAFWFREGITFSTTATQCMSFRHIINSVYDMQGPTFFATEGSLWTWLAFLNSSYSSYIASIFNPTMVFQISDILKIPIQRNHEIEHELAILGDLSTQIKKKLAQIAGEANYANWMSLRDHITSVIDNELKVSSILHTIEAIIDDLVLVLMGVNANDFWSLCVEPRPAHNNLIIDYATVPSIENQIKHYDSYDIITKTHSSPKCVDQDLPNLRQRLRGLYEAGPGVKEETDEAEAKAGHDDDGENEQVAVGTRILIPAETFLEELSQKLEVHPISVYWLLKEGIEKEGWRCLPEEQRLTKDRFTVLILRLLGHRWPKQIEAGEALPVWADGDGIIPLTEGAEELNLHNRLRERLAAEYGNERVSSEENAFAEIMGKPLKEWLRRDFFRHHCSQFKKRPIAWQVTSAQGNGNRRQDSALEVMIYYHQVDGDLLPKLRSQHLGPLQKRCEMELHGLEKAPGRTLSAEEENRRNLLRSHVGELKAFDETLSNVISEGFAPASIKPLLRQNALNDAMLCLKSRWLRRLGENIAAGPLAEWKTASDRTELHPELSAWIAEAMVHLDHHCTAVGPGSPEQVSLSDDPTSAELAAVIEAEMEAMVPATLTCACDVWWRPFDRNVLKPLAEQIRDAKKEQKSLKDQARESSVSAKERMAIADRLDALKREIRTWQEELNQKTGKGQAVREAIQIWRCPEALTWGDWLSEQAMYDQVSSLDRKRPPPRTIQEFILQEGAYQPDVNDGVRVNIAPLQQAGILTVDVLAAKDVEKAIADRAAWRDDERRWCREGKLPKPGWWE